MSEVCCDATTTIFATIVAIHHPDQKCNPFSNLRDGNLHLTGLQCFQYTGERLPSETYTDLTLYTLTL